MELCICNGTLDVDMFVYKYTHIYIASAIYKSGKRHELGFVHSTGIRVHKENSLGTEVKQAKNGGLPFIRHIITTHCYGMYRGQKIQRI